MEQGCFIFGCDAGEELPELFGSHPKVTLTAPWPIRRGRPQSGVAGQITRRLQPP
jgi:hypothetical protein